jgi:hypothetical protein
MGICCGERSLGNWERTLPEGMEQLSAVARAPISANRRASLRRYPFCETMVPPPTGEIRKGETESML